MFFFLTGENVLVSSSQSLDLNLIENLCRELKLRVMDEGTWIWTFVDVKNVWISQTQTLKSTSLAQVPALCKWPQHCFFPKLSMLLQFFLGWIFSISPVSVTTTTMKQLTAGYFRLLVSAWHVFILSVFQLQHVLDLQSHASKLEYNRIFFWLFH